jgi:hypothetical protein
MNRIMRTGMILLLAFFLPGVVLQDIQAASDVKVIPNLPPLDVLKAASHAWENIQDYQGLIHQIEQQPNGVRELWATVTLIKQSKNPKDAPMFMVRFYDFPIPDDSTGTAIAGATPIVVYFSSDGKELVTFKPAENSLTVKPLEGSGPLPEFLYIAGFVDLNLDQLRERNEGRYVLQPVEELQL